MEIINKPLNISERISSLDVLRGFALLGIVLVNVLGFNASFFNFGGFYNNLPNHFQQDFYNIYISLTADKFIFLFGFLFGYGIFIQYDRFSKKNVKFNAFFCRRILILCVLGIVHIIFLWAGDILFCYSIAGFVILLLLKLSTKWLILIAIFFYFFIVIWLTISLILPLPDAMSSTHTENLEKAKLIYLNDNYFECLNLRIQEYIAFRNINAFYYLPKIIGISILGFIASKYKLHQKVKDNKPKWTIVLLINALIAVITYFGYEKIVNFNSPYAKIVYMGGYEFMNLFIASSYLLFILFLSSFKSVADFLKPIALMGRMSLTNYIMQSILLSVIFYGWGFGFFGHTNIVLLVFIALCVFLFQLILNIIWFKYYNQGPLEKLWRKLSYRN